MHACMHVSVQVGCAPIVCHCSSQSNDVAHYSSCSEQTHIWHVCFKAPICWTQIMITMIDTFHSWLYISHKDINNNIFSSVEIEATSKIEHYSLSSAMTSLHASHITPDTHWDDLPGKLGEEEWILSVKNMISWRSKLLYQYSAAVLY